MPRFKPQELRGQLKLAVGRLRLQNRKRENATQKLMAEISQLLLGGKEQTARVRTDAIIRNRNLNSAYQLLELYAETLLSRLPSMELSIECPPELLESLRGVVYASARVEIPEFKVVRFQLANKYGQILIQNAVENIDCCVNPQLVQRLGHNPPPAQQTMTILREIALKHGFEWDPSEEMMDFCADVVTEPECCVPPDADDPFANSFAAIPSRSSDRMNDAPPSSFDAGRSPHHADVGVPSYSTSGQSATAAVATSVSSPGYYGGKTCEEMTLEDYERLFDHAPLANLASAPAPTTPPPVTAGQPPTSLGAYERLFENAHIEPRQLLHPMADTIPTNTPIVDPPRQQQQQQQQQSQPQQTSQQLSPSDNAFDLGFPSAPRTLPGHHDDNDSGGSSCPEDEEMDALKARFEALKRRHR